LVSSPDGGISSLSAVSCGIVSAGLPGCAKAGLAVNARREAEDSAARFSLRIREGSREKRAKNAQLVEQGFGKGKDFRLPRTIEASTCYINAT
jgi:hypothetical protein